jgi:dephospho-CoA kinase
MKTIGITGGIGSGKSAVTDYLLERDYAVIDADLIAREVVAVGTDGLAAVVSSFGESVLLEDGSLDRKSLAARVFSDDGARAELNAVLHGLISRTIEERLARCRAAGEPTVFVSAPLLIETGMQNEFYAVWLVDVDEDERVRRVVLRDSLSAEAVRMRIAAQASSFEKAKYASEIINNSGTISDLRRAVSILLEKYNI